MDLITFSLIPNKDELPWWQPNLASENTQWRQVQMQYQAFWEAFRKFHHQLCRNQERLKLMSLTCQVPWPLVAATELICLEELMFYSFHQELISGKGPEGKIWGADVARRRHSDSAGNTLWLQADARGSCRDWLMQYHWLSKAEPLLPIFEVKYMVLLQSWKAKLQTLSSLWDLNSC